MEKKGAIFILFIILLSFNLKAQNEIGNLENLLNQSIEDSIRVQTLSTLAWELKYKNINKAMSFAEEALELSLKIGHKKEQARALQYISQILIGKGQYDEAIEFAFPTQTILTPESTPNINSVVTKMNEPLNK